MLKKLLFAALWLPFTLSANQNNIDVLAFNSQAEFNAFSEDLTGALVYKTLIPTDFLGIGGFDIGVSYSESDLQYATMDNVSAHGSNTLNAYTIHIVKGLPYDLDLELNYSQVLDSNIATLGGALSYALIEGGTFMPAVNIKGFYNQMNDVKALDYSNYGGEVSVSKGFANLTPYAALGVVNSEISPDSRYETGVALQKENVSLPKYALGVNVNLAIMDLLVGFNQVGDVPTYSVKAGYRF